MSPGLFTPMVPMESGKTLDSLEFALDHARQHGHQRIIYAIPPICPACDSTLATRVTEAGIEAFALMPRLADFNDDLQHQGRAVLRTGLQGQLIAEDRDRFAGSG